MTSSWFVYVFDRGEYPELSHYIKQRDFGDCIAYKFASKEEAEAAGKAVADKASRVEVAEAVSVAFTSQCDCHLGEKSTSKCSGIHYY
jgi:hypothetical protein